MTDEPTIIEGTSNIFEDLGLPDAEIRLAKAELARVIRRAIVDRGLTQREAALVMGLKQPDVSDLMRGRLARFSMERLELCLNHLDMDIRIQVASRPTWKARAGLTVEFLPA
ncbi:MAG TPA: helix-turn-helix transcriptional regulator [Gemmatimonadales bacterium]|nr:helix-turn-helix transcriptional regulator [Gemmatimonadales bacterium]